MMRVAIVGCGKIADQHVQAIRRIAVSEIVAVCDREPLMAAQLADRFDISGRFSDVEELLCSAKPDVVHVTTPPQSHREIAAQCLEAGAHVYLEKPFTVTAPEALDVIERAGRVDRLVTAGHNMQFSFEMLRLRQLLNGDFLGGRPVHIESYWSYDLGDTSYVGPLLGDPSHWVRRLPGGLLHNIISHGIARIAAFLEDELTELHANAHQSERLRQMGGKEVMDELRVMMRDRAGTTATFCFTTQVHPGLNQLRLFGPKNSVTVDFISGSVIPHRGVSYKSYLTYLVPPYNDARAHLANAWRNAMDILRWRLYQDAGLTEIVRRFHEAAATIGGVTADSLPRSAAHRKHHGWHLRPSAATGPGCVYHDPEIGTCG